MALSFQSILRAFRVRGAATSFGYPTNSNADLSCDEDGNLYVRQATPPAAIEWTQKNYGSSFALRASAGLVTQVGGYNDSGTSAYLLLFDTAAVPAPATVPMQSFLVPANSTFGWTPTLNGRRLTNGLCYGVSSTPNAYTVLAGNFWVFAEGTTQ